MTEFVCVVCEDDGIGWMDERDGRMCVVWVRMMELVG